jgi:WD40 repeat protein
MEKDIEISNYSNSNNSKINYNVMKNSNNYNSNIDTNYNLDSYKDFKHNLKSFQTATNSKKYLLDNSFYNKTMLINYNINEAYNLISTESTKPLIKSNTAILSSKRGVLNNDFISSLSNFQINYNTITDKGILCEKTYSEHSERINDIDVIPDHSAVSSASNDGTIKLWDLKGSTSSAKTFNTGKPVWSVHTHGEYLCAGIEKDLVIWSLKTMKPFAKINFLHSEAILSIKIQIINGKPYLVSTGDDGLINVLDISTQKITTDNVVSTINTNQTMLFSELVNDVNVVQALTASESLIMFNLENNSEIVSFDFNAEGLGSNYIVNSKIRQNSSEKIDVVLGSNKYVLYGLSFIKYY